MIAHLLQLPHVALLELSRQLPLNDEKHGYYEKVALELTSIGGKVYNGFTTRVERPIASWCL